MLCPGDSPEHSFCCGGIEESSSRAGGIFKELKNKKNQTHKKPHVNWVYTEKKKRLRVEQVRVYEYAKGYFRKSLCVAWQLDK